MPVELKDRRGEPRWPALLGILAIVGLYISLPERLTPGPTWVLVSAVVVIIIPLVFTYSTGRHRINAALGVVLLAIITVAIVWSLFTLVAGLPGKRQPPVELLRSAVALWLSNVLVFASWYWRLDAGGPHIRDQRSAHTEGSFLFPQMTVNPESKLRINWKPGFVDYLFLAFNTSTAFSPTDVPVLSPWAKLLMMMQSLISLGTVALVAARAINIV
jgi:hypothetical protein